MCLHGLECSLAFKGFSAFGLETPSIRAVLKTILPGGELARDFLGASVSRSACVHVNPVFSLPILYPRSGWIRIYFSESTLNICAKVKRK